MIRFAIAALFVGHGLVHAVMFALPYSAQASADLPFNPSHSWLIGNSRTFGFVFALLVTLLLFVAGAGYLWRASWWPQVTLVAAVLSLALLVLYLSRWWIVGYAISIALAIAAWRALTAA
jgi:uncharacterized membrane protein (DUF485 family)